MDAHGAGSDSGEKRPPVTVTFEVAEGQVWIDQQEVAWRIALIDGDIAHMERVAVEQRHVRDLVRNWRQMGDRHEPA